MRLHNRPDALPRGLHHRAALPRCDAVALRHERDPARARRCRLRALLLGQAARLRAETPVVPLLFGTAARLDGERLSDGGQALQVPDPRLPCGRPFKRCARGAPLGAGVAFACGGGALCHGRRHGRTRPLLLPLCDEPLRLAEGRHDLRLPALSRAARAALHRRVRLHARAFPAEHPHLAGALGRAHRGHVPLRAALRRRRLLRAPFHPAAHDDVRRQGGDAFLRALRAVFHLHHARRQPSDDRGRAKGSALRHVVRAASGVRVPVRLYARLSGLWQLCAVVCRTRLQLGQHVQRHALRSLLRGRSAGAHDHA